MEPFNEFLNQLEETRTQFLKHLEEDEDDEATRLVYSDWLEANGEYAEAQRQRQWSEAKRRLEAFIASYKQEMLEQWEEDQSGLLEAYPDFTFESYEEERSIKLNSYKDLVEVFLSGECYNAEELCDKLRDEGETLIESVEVITGKKINPDDVGFSCAC